MELGTHINADILSTTLILVTERKRYSIQIHPRYRHSQLQREEGERKGGGGGGTK